MNINRIKLVATAIFAIPVIMVVGFRAEIGHVSAATDDPATTYKTKCAACHTPTASKFYDPAKTDDEHVAAIMKGKKGEKPPYMPAFGEKGMTEDEAKGLAGYMKTLKPAAN
jgi:mono/diheme cytochrome c family protein